MALLTRKGNCLIWQCKVTRMHAHIQSLVGVRAASIAREIIVDWEIKMIQAGSILQGNASHYIQNNFFASMLNFVILMFCYTHVILLYITMSYQFITPNLNTLLETHLNIMQSNTPPPLTKV